MVTLDEIVEVMGEVIDVSDVPRTPDAVLGRDLPVDSQEMLRILSRVESRYRFRFAPAEFIRIQTLGDLVEIVRARTQGTET